MVLRSHRMKEKNAASANTMGRFETQMLSVQDNLEALSEVNGQWVERALEKTSHRRIILDLDSSARPVHGEQEGSAYNGHFGCTCYPPLFCFNQFGDCEGARLRPGNVHSADGWKELLGPIVARYEQSTLRVSTFRGMPPSPSRRSMNTWRRRAFCIPSGFPPTRCCRQRLHPC